MSKVTALTTLSFQGQQIARAGKQFESKGLPDEVLQSWAAKGWCSPLPASRVSGKALSQSKKSNREMD